MSAEMVNMLSEAQATPVSQGEMITNDIAFQVGNTGIRQSELGSITIRGDRPENIEQAVQAIMEESPDANIAVRSGVRTIRRQSELMVERIRASIDGFTQGEGSYISRPHTEEMKAWQRANPNSSVEKNVDAFESIIRRARNNGAVVSNHLSDHARDITIPIGTTTQLNQIESRFNEIGVRVIREPNAVGGPHWHLDWEGEE
jgi:hypothetical protein